MESSLIEIENKKNRSSKCFFVWLKIHAKRNNLKLKVKLLYVQFKSPKSLSA